MTNVYDLDLLLYPELIAAAFKKKEIDSFIIWSILKTIDKDATNKSHGIVSHVVKIIQDIFGVNNKQAYTKIAQGVDKYWFKPGGIKNKKIGLFSWEKVVTKLSPELPKTQPFKIKIYELVADNCLNGSYLKSVLLGVVASRLGHERPMSIMSIVECTGLSKRTVYNLLHACPRLQKIVHYALVSPEIDVFEGQRAQIYAQNNGIHYYRTINSNKGVLIVRRLPNSYYCDLERVSTNFRPKPLKKYDTNNYNVCTASKYKTQKKNNCLGVLDTNNLGKIHLWKNINSDVLRIKTL